MKMGTYLGFILFLSLVACADKGASSSSSSTVNPTIYFKPSVSGNKDQCKPNELKDILDKDGKILVTVCQDDFKECLLQGSCFVRVGDQIKSINIGEKVDGAYRFVENSQTKCPFGLGVQNICLDPFYSVAADLSIYKPGTVIYIPRLAKLPLPDGTIHDGFVIVRDSGDAIKGPHRFDFFTGTMNHLHRENTLARVGFGDSKNSFEFRTATVAESAQVLQRRRFPLVP